MAKSRAKAAYMISAVADRYGIHPQTLRLYEREGLLCPERSAGNTRLYSRRDIEHLGTILNLTREMGVNLAGVTIIMDLLEKLRQIQQEKQALLTMQEVLDAQRLTHVQHRNTPA